MSILSFLGGLVGIGPTRRTITISKEATNAGLPFVMGEARVKAIPVFTAISRQNHPLGATVYDFKYDPLPSHGDEDVKDAMEWLHRIDVFAQGPITDFVRFYVDSDVHSSARFGTRPYFRTVGYFGSLTQTAFAWGAVTAKRDTNHRGIGVAYAISRFYAHGKYPKYNSEPPVEAVIKGMALYDPRPAAAQTEGDESSYTFSENAALGLLRYLTTDTGADWGFVTLDIDSFNDAADSCDIAVTIPARPINTTGGPVTWSNKFAYKFDVIPDGTAWPTHRRDQVGTGQARIVGSFILDPEAGVKENIETLLEVMHGHLPFSNGKYKLIIEDVVGAVVMPFDEDSILGNWKIKDGGRGDRLNRATVTFVNKNKSYKEDSVSWPKLDSATYTTLLGEDNGEKLFQTFDVPSIPDYYQAAAWAEFQVRNSRANKRVTVDLAPKAMVLEYGDVISLTSAARGWTAKWFRVRKNTLKTDGTCTVDLVEYDASIYAWSTKDDEPLEDTGDAPFVWDDPIALAGLTATGFHDVKVDGSVVSGFDVVWTAPTDTVELDYVEINWRVSGEPNYTNTSRVETDSTTVRLEPLVDDTLYDIRVIYRTNLGQISISSTMVNKYLGNATSRLSDIEDGATNGATLGDNIRIPYGGAYVIRPASDVLNSSIVFPNLTLVPDANIDVRGNSIEKINLSGWDGSAYSEHGFAGSARVTWTTDRGDDYYTMGLNSDPTIDSSYASIDFGFVLRATGNVDVYENGVQKVAVVTTYVAGDRFEITWDGVKIKYYKNDTWLYTSSVSLDLSTRLHVDNSIWQLGDKINNIAFSQGPTLIDTVGTAENLLSGNAGPEHTYSSSFYFQSSYIRLADINSAVGQYLGLSGELKTDGTGGESARLVLAFYTAADGFISNLSLAGSVASTAFEYVSGTKQIPATCDRVRVFAYWLGGQVGTKTIKRVMLNRGPVIMPYVKATADGVWDVSGRLVDLYRSPMTRAMGPGSARVSNPLTAVDAGATATINVAAHTVYNGDATGIAYNVGSITGLAFSTYYLVYVDDANYAGGAVTYIATTASVNVAKALGRYFVGTVTTPADGGGSIGGGGGVGGECVAISMWLTDVLQAEDLVSGNALDVLDEKAGLAIGDNYSAQPMHSVDYSEQPCVEIESNGGAILVCSISTPVTAQTGKSLQVTHCLGERLPTVIDGVFEWQEIIKVKDVGLKLVAHIHVGGRTFAAGTEARARIFTHNAVKL